MEAGALGLDAAAAATGPPSDRSLAHLRRRAWAKSRDSLWQETQPEASDARQDPQNREDPAGDEPRSAEEQEPGNVPNKITSWLIECRTPIGASLDDQSASPSKGAPRNGCSFEDDLSLGAEANHLQSSGKKTGSCFGLPADQKRSLYKEKGRSMNSTGSGKSSTVSRGSEVSDPSEQSSDEILLTLRVSELLDLYEEDPEEILLNLGFGRDEPDLSSKIPSRFFNGSSSARGIDIKVYLGAQLQRMEVENPNYALTSRFRQIEVLTTVANEFFQLYSQVSGQPLQRITSKEQEGDGSKEESPPPLKRSSSAINAAKLLKKTISKRNLLMAASESPVSPSPPPQAQHNGTDANAVTNGTTSAPPELDPDHQVETLTQKPSRKKDARLLATVTEETNGDGDAERLSELSNSALATAAPRTEGEKVTLEKELNLTSGPEKAPAALAPPLLAQLRTENADSFDMEEIQSNEDEAPLTRTSRNSDLLRTVSQQSDSSGFAEEPSLDLAHLTKTGGRPGGSRDEDVEVFQVQVSSDSCDSETTVTSHPSQDVATPLATDQRMFDLPDGGEKLAEVGDRSSSLAKERDGNPDPLPVYSAHQLPGGGSNDVPREETEQDLTPEPEHGSRPPVQTQNPDPPGTEPEPALHQEGPGTSEDQVERATTISASSSLVQNALHRAKQQRPIREGGPGRGVPLQRSSSLPSSLLSPSRVVSSVRIQFGRDRTAVTQPSYSFKYNQEDGGDSEEDGQSSCLSTLIINPPSRPPVEDQLPQNHFQRNPLRPSHSLQSHSPPPEASLEDHGSPWSSQSVPDLCYAQQHPGPFQQGATPAHHHHHQMFPYPSSAPYFSPVPSPGLGIPPQYPPQYPPPLNMYASLPNVFNPSPSHHSSLTSLHHPPTPAPLHHPSASQMYAHPYAHQYHSAPHPPPHFASPWLGYQGYNPGSPFPQPLPHGFHPLYPSPGGVQGAELQLRSVLDDIRGTVQSLCQSRAETPDPSAERRAASFGHQSLTEFHQKRRSLNMFRSQMMNLEMLIIQQQAQVYKHLSPAERMELEQLQSLRSAVREELQELEQQLEERLIELTQNTPRTDLGSVDSLASNSALRAMEPVSDLLREQLFLRSELGYEGGASAGPSSRSSSPVRDADRTKGVYRSCINITPVPPPRPDAPDEAAEGGTEEGRGGEAAPPEVPGGVGVENLQQLIREIRESVTQEVRREIFNELMAAVSPGRPSLPARQHPL